MRKGLFLMVWLMVLVLGLGLVSQAGAVDKQIPIVNTWNLLNLPIDPTNKGPNQILSDLSYKSVWKWDAQGQKWQVYLATGNDATQSYATSKGFGVLSQINGGEGFWVNSNEAKSITVSGVSFTNDQHNLVKGWNLIGLKSEQDATVQAILQSLTSSGINAVSLWAWDATNQKWRVFIPSYNDTQLSSYITSKGFSKLDTVKSTEGFWVNASQGGSVTETPPEVGKAYKATGENTYIPLANADVYVNGQKIGTTDSNGNFKLPENLKPTDVITIGSGDQFTISASELKNGGLYLFAQDQDKNKVLLESTGGSQKATPKVITSSDGKASITISNLQLTKDITAAVTPYKTPISPPSVGKIKALDPKYMVVAGADVSFVDSMGNNISLEEAGFGGQVVPKAKNFLGEFTGEVLYKYLGNGDPDNATGSLWLLAYVDGAYTVVGQAELKEDTSSNKPKSDQNPTAGAKTYYLQPATGVVIQNLLCPFVFVFKQDYLVGELEITVTNAGILYKTANGDQLVTEGTEGKGAVVDENYNSPVKGALVTTDNSDEFQVTDANGKAKIKYILPPNNPNLGIIVKKDGYFDGTASVNVVDESSKEVKLAELPDTAAVGGMVYDTKTQKGIAGAKVTLKNPIVLDKIMDDGETITVGLDSTATYKWEVRKQGQEGWVTVDEGQGHYTLTKTQVAKKLIENFASLSNEDKAKLGANPIGTYDVKITVTHPFSNYTYVESAQGYLDITVDMTKWEQTASLSEGQLGQVSVFGGKDLGFYYATAPVGVNPQYTWVVYINSWDDANQNNVADEGEVKTIAQSDPVSVPFFPFTEAINLVQKNYLKLLVPPEGGWNDPSVDDNNSYLQEGVSIRVEFQTSYLFGPNNIPTSKTVASEFDLKSNDPLSTLTLGKLQIIPNTTMAFEETQTTKEDGSYLFAFVDPQLDGLLGIYASALAYFPNSIFLGTEYPLLKGWITEVNIGLNPVELPPEPGAQPEPIDVTKAAAMEWVETWENASQAESAAISTTNGQWVVSGNDLNDVQWWLLTNPETMGPAAIPGIDYPVPEGATGTAAQPYLLPAYEGTKVAWFGSKTTFTFSDSGQNTSNGYKKGELVSPEIDLANFSFATLEFATWWEVESVDVAKWQYDQMKVMVAVVDATPQTPVQVGDFKFTGPNDFKTVAWLNPDYEVAVQSANINYSSGGNDAVPVWVKIVANLNPFAGHKIKLMFSFNSMDSLFNGFRGWAVDEIKIKNEDSGLPITVWGDYWWWKPALRAE